jgi:hypothetical protein
VNEALKSKLGLVEGLALVAVAVGCLAFQLWVPTTQVPEGDYLAVQQVLAAEAKPGDVVLLAPWWTERARLYVPEGLPVVGYQGSDADPLVFYGRIWVLAEPDLPRAGQHAFHEAFDPGRTEDGQERRFGHLSLRRYQNGRAKPVRFSAAQALGRAKAWYEAPDGTRTDCTFDGTRHRCPGNNFIDVEWHEVNFEPRLCLRFFPPGGPTRLTLEFEGVPAAQSLELSAGYTWDRGYFKPKDGVTSSDLSLEVNGVKTMLPLPWGLVGRQQVAVAQTPEGATVRVQISAQNAKDRDVCMELYGFGGTP